ncbi:NAD kinase [Actinotalea fermentans]|uniref:NAD kinase n=1 Tax=Actinotalea fermentans TaxID=43671 RepID=A0A511YVH8_9CELL|nr:NAD kinase [Actinotalea fermentans]KGM17194.1 inorganic polyphosphate kinase [Actinotalea fermentans ATCC 43279 = JCM 9966 = DSM 3133]GEN79179.1 NAD kinase 2 [Actinotalea fermentans]
MNRSVLVIAHNGRPDAQHAAEQVAVALRSVDLVPVTEEELPDVDDLGMVLVLGGDGTILRAAELTRGMGVPLLGFNLGHVGFLAEAEREDIDEVVRRIAEGRYEVEERGTIEVRVQRPGAELARDWALNDATIEKGDPARMIEVVVEVDGRPLSSFGCDGVVMATSTGSTAHAFSAGGPVVWPDVEGMLLVPVSAHALFARPLVVGPSSVLAVEVMARSVSSGVLSCDGRRTMPLPVGTRVEVRHSDVPVRLARLARAPFTDRLVSRFDLPVSGWRGRAPNGHARHDA